MRLVDRVEKEARSGRIRTQDEFMGTLRREIENRSHRDLSALPEEHAPPEVRPLILAMNALLECQHRIQTVALVHEQIYLTRDLSRIPFAPYVRRLAAADVARFSERIRMEKPDQLVDEMTIEDPIAFARPWRVTLRYRRVAELDRLWPETDRLITNGGTV